jgi:hypothetical protein
MPGYAVAVIADHGYNRAAVYGIAGIGRDTLTIALRLWYTGAAWVTEERCRPAGAGEE